MEGVLLAGGLATSTLSDVRQHSSAARSPLAYSVAATGRRGGGGSVRPRLANFASALRRPVQVARSKPGLVVTASSSSLGRKWEARVISTAEDEDKEDDAGINLLLAVLDKDSEARSSSIVLDDLPWEKKPKQGGLLSSGPTSGWSRKGAVALPTELGTPGAVVITKLRPKKGSKVCLGLDYITTVLLKRDDGVEFEFPVQSWISSEHGERVFFAGSAYLPKDTPKPLLDERARDLELLRGVGGGPQDATDRVYDYQVYDDLGSAEAYRPAMGGFNVDGQVKLPYPRHLANLKIEGTFPFGKPWVPLDEEFALGKKEGFKNGRVMGLMQALTTSMADKLELETGSNFASYEDIYEIFRKGSSGWNVDLDQDTVQRVEEQVKDKPTRSSAAVKAPWFQTMAAGISVERVLTGLGDKMKGGNESFRFDQPRVMKGRREVWATDKEVGRQCLAGMNPCALAALKQMPTEFGSAIGPQHVDAEIKALGGSSLAQHVNEAAAGAKPRLFFVDYWLLDTFWGEDKSDAADRTEHAGRMLLFLQEGPDGKDIALLPIAVELKHKGTHALERAAGRELPASAGLVYARQELAHDADKLVLWMLAKAVFCSLDAAVHQLVSHWLRSHACPEPFAIAMHRNISTMHPVYKLMKPHFRYALEINARARTDLIAAKAVIEQTFTPAEYAIRLSSAAYKGWRFGAQALPTDLQNRGMVDASGKPWMDYPYADDGLDMWRELQQYFASYLGLYYKSDADVAGDEELQSWWHESKNKGHQDLKHFEPDEAKAWGFAGPITTRDQLVHVLTTIAWTTSGHHAAVNFGQYDFGGFMLNISSLIRRPIPRPGDEQDPAYQALVHAGSEAKRESEYLTYVADRKSMLRQLVTVKLLSTHAEDEHYLTMPNERITEPAAEALNAQFIARMAALESAFEARNQDPARWTRRGGHRDAMEYTLLLPSSPPGLTLRGVPYSVCI